MLGTRAEANHVLSPHARPKRGNNELTTIGVDPKSHRALKLFGWERPCSACVAREQGCLFAARVAPKVRPKRA
jgi:hypothetical protein